MFTNSFVSLNSDGDGKSFFSDPKVRLALVQAVDRQKIVSEVLAGRADARPHPPPTPGGGHPAPAAALHPYEALAAAQNPETAGRALVAGPKRPGQKERPGEVTRAG